MSPALLGQQLPILVPAFAAGLLVLATHVPLGREVLRRGIIFMDLAIAQVAALGVILGSWAAAAADLDMGHGHHGPGYQQLIACAAAIAGASALYTVRHASARVQEALIGSLFVLAATGSILLLSGNPQAGEQLKAVLVGQILWVEYRDLLAAGVVSCMVLLAWSRWRERLGGYWFYPLFAVAITFSTQLVGIYLVFASLIIPALASHGFRRPNMAAYVIGASGYAGGLAGSALLDLPSGALVVWMLAIAGAAARAAVRAQAGGR